MGGNSAEYEISLFSGCGILSNLNYEKYDVSTIIIDKSGDWHLYFGDIEKIKSDKWQENISDFRRVEFTNSGKLIMCDSAQDFKTFDVVFPILHGFGGEDGKIQGMFELSATPYVGCGATCSSVCMDKYLTNTILEKHGINIPKWITFWCNERKVIAQMQAAVEKSMEYPVFVKPASNGSSIGVVKVKHESELLCALEFAFAKDEKVLVQQAIEGSEVECAILEGRELIVSVPGEIEPCNEFYDYEAKYLKPSVLHIPARISEAAKKEVQLAAKCVYELLSCRSMARVDFIVDKRGKPWFLEVNTIPGFTEISMYPKLMMEAGLRYSELIDRLIELAVT
jgi:D-alanine-D-alanine ligase